MFAHSVEYKRFDLGRRYPRDAARLGFPILNEGLRHIIAVAHSQPVRVGRAHAVVAVIEDPSHQQSWRAFQTQLTNDRIAGKLALHCLEDRTFHNGLMLTTMVLTAVGHLANVNAVLEQIGGRLDSMSGRTEP